MGVELEGELLILFKKGHYASGRSFSISVIEPVKAGGYLTQLNNIEYDEALKLLSPKSKEMLLNINPASKPYGKSGISKVIIQQGDDFEVMLIYWYDG
jgi:hypothetical protein